MQILNLSAAVPNSEYSIDEMVEVFPCQIPDAVKQNILNLGVSKKYFVNPVDLFFKSEASLSVEGLVDLCSDACELAVEKTGLSVRDIGYFVVTYDAIPFLCPGLSHLLIKNIGFNSYIKHVNVQGMACSAFTKALELAGDHLTAYPEDFVLLCISGVNSYWFYNQVRGLKDVMEIGQINSLKDKDRRRIELRKWIATMEFFLFGDGVASVIVGGNGDGLGLSVNKIVEVTNLRKKDYLAGYAKLAATNEPFKFGFHSHLAKEIPTLGVQYTSLVLKKLFGKKAENAMKDVKKWAVHTGSEKILYLLAEHHGIQPDKIRESHEVLREYGNLSGASLPFILEKIVSGNKFSRGDIVLTLGYGWGFSASACLLEFMK